MVEAPIQFGKPLTKNQIVCLVFLAQGKTRKEMAYELGIEQSTVYSRFRSMREATHVYRLLTWDYQMTLWIRVNPEKVLKYVESIGTSHTLHQLCLAAGLELIE